MLSLRPSQFQEGSAQTMIAAPKRRKPAFFGIFLRFLFLLGTLLSLTASTSSVSEQHQGDAGTILVDFNSIVRKRDPLAFGMDISGIGAPSAFANDQVEAQKLRALGITYLRIDLKYADPGNTASKIICGGSGCDTRWTGDQWVQAIKAIGAQPLVIVPLDTVEAASLVKHFNTQAETHVHSWMIGNEPDQANIPAEVYSQAFNQAYDAMKAIDPTISIGGGATAWYDEPFLRQFLQTSGSRVDFVDFHGYAQKGDVPGDTTTLFQKAVGYGKDIEHLRALIQEIVPARASHIGIEVGEWELNWGGSAQNDTNFHAVWTASVLANILKAGGWSLFYADKGNALYASQHTFLDPSGQVVHVNVDDTNPAYHGLGMFTGEGLFQGFGDTIVSTNSTLPQVEVLASDHPQNIVVINQDPTLTQTATFTLHGAASALVEVWRKDESVLFPDPPIRLGTLQVCDGTFTYQLTPSSITVFVLKSAAFTTPPPAPPDTC